MWTHLCINDDDPKTKTVVKEKKKERFKVNSFVRNGEKWRLKIN